eukprot:gene15416-11023_t
MLLFQLDSGLTHLHTGDMRYHPRMKEYPALQAAKIDRIYLDTTYAHPKHQFQPQSQSIDDIIHKIKDFLFLYREQGLVYLSAYNLGKERVIFGVQDALGGLPIYMDDDKINIMNQIEGGRERVLSGRFTNNPLKANIHICGMGMAGFVGQYFRANFDNLESHRVELNELKQATATSVTKENIHSERLQLTEFTHVLAFIPTGWAESSTYNRSHSYQVQNHTAVQLIPYSEHSQYQELMDFVEFLKPREVIPTVYADDRNRVFIVHLFRNLVDKKQNMQNFLNKFKKTSSASLSSMLTEDGDDREESMAAVLTSSTKSDGSFSGGHGHGHGHGHDDEEALHTSHHQQVPVVSEYTAPAGGMMNLWLKSQRSSSMEISSFIHPDIAPLSLPSPLSISSNRTPVTVSSSSVPASASSQYPATSTTQGAAATAAHPPFVSTSTGMPFASLLPPPIITNPSYISSTIQQKSATSTPRSAMMAAMMAAPSAQPSPAAAAATAGSHATIASSATASSSSTSTHYHTSHQLPLHISSSTTNTQRSTPRKRTATEVVSDRISQDLSLTLSSSSSVSPKPPPTAAAHLMSPGMFARHQLLARDSDDDSADETAGVGTGPGGGGDRSEFVPRIGSLQSYSMDEQELVDVVSFPTAGSHASLASLASYAAAGSAATAATATATAGGSSVFQWNTNTNTNAMHHHHGGGGGGAHPMVPSLPLTGPWNMPTSTLSLSAVVTGGGTNSSGVNSGVNSGASSTACTPSLAMLSQWQQ